MKEVIDGTETDDSKIFMSPSHTLTIKHFNMHDSGIYTCKRYNNMEDSIFTFVLDGVFHDNIVTKSGSKSQWLEYKQTKIDKLNKKFIRSQEKPLTIFKDTYKFSFRIIICWESWGPCEAFGRRHKGVRKRLGKCRLHPIPQNDSIEDAFDDDFLTNMTAFYLMDNYDVPCRSIKFYKFFPEIGKLVRKIPEFEINEACNLAQYSQVIDKPAVAKKYFKYETTIQLVENGHATLVCPEVTWETKVNWFKDIKMLNSSFRNNMADSDEEPHLTIDTYNSLHVLHVTKTEEGTYTCTVNGNNVKKFYLKIVSKSKVLNQEFIRYSIYLGFVLSLTITCYCAGVCVAWHRRTSFVDPLNLNKRKNCCQYQRLFSEERNISNYD